MGVRKNFHAFIVKPFLAFVFKTFHAFVFKTFHAFIFTLLICGSVQAVQNKANLAKQEAPAPTPAPAVSEDPTSKLKAFLGKWDSQAAFASGMKASAQLDCTWSPQGKFLVCEQHVKLQDGDQKREQHQLTVYSYNAKENVYRYSTISDPGMAPSTGVVDIKGNVWTYDSSFENDGKIIKIHNTNTFTDAKNEVFKIVTSDDGGTTWKPLLDGSAHKVGN